MYSALTEITETEESSPARGWIFYDRDCRSCRELARRFQGVFARRGFEFEPLQQKWMQERLNLTAAEALEEMRVLTLDGQVFGGADAIIFLSTTISWAAPLSFVARFSAVQELLHSVYRWIAAHRTCVIPHRQKTPVGWRTRWVPLVLLPIASLIAKPALPPWGFMWTMAGAIFLGCKWLTLGLAAQRNRHIRPLRAAAYLFAWPGMDAARFLNPNPTPRPSVAAILKNTSSALTRIGLGALLLFVVARRIEQPLAIGWIGMLGMILILHFGVFELASIGWLLLRVNARPIMNAPLRATSISEFWGRRWNAASNDLALRFVFQPLARNGGPVRATLAAFLVSGLIHELVISLPAGAGYGLPTIYFLIQGLGVLLERHTQIRGRLVTLTIVAAPAFWLFHPPFVRQIILPFMQAIGTL